MQSVRASKHMLMFDAHVFLSTARSFTPTNTCTHMAELRQRVTTTQSPLDRNAHTPSPTRPVPPLTQRKERSRVERFCAAGRHRPVCSLATHAPVARHPGHWAGSAHCVDGRAHAGQDVGVKPLLDLPTRIWQAAHAVHQLLGGLGEVHPLAISGEAGRLRRQEAGEGGGAKG